MYSGAEICQNSYNIKKIKKSVKIIPNILKTDHGPLIEFFQFSEQLNFISLEENGIHSSVVLNLLIPTNLFKLYSSVWDGRFVG
jgi:hypothetical protein